MPHCGFWPANTTCIAISGVLALWPARPGIIRMHRGYTGASEPAKPRDGRVGLTSTPLRNISGVHSHRTLLGDRPDSVQTDSEKWQLRKSKSHLVS